ncbi:arsenate reductase (glutaredoxin) [Hydrogenophaga defluvii]|uniref:Arsenate reductase n=1 Tax=Hydrogenophaga defluvii TaxID=249410 RepID=A0ABW2SC83_9BURK
MSHITIYHNPKCGTSRNTLALIRDNGFEPQVIEYLKTPPTRAELMALLHDLGLGVRDILREKEAVYSELGLANTALSDAQLLDALEQHPILMQRPIVRSAMGVRLCRPAERVLDILPPTQKPANT